MGGSLGDLFLKLGVDTSEFTKPLEEAGKQIEIFSNKSVGLAQSLATQFTFAAGGAALVDLGKKAFESAVKFQDMDRIIGRATGTTGAALESLSDSAKHLFAGSAASTEVISSALSTLAIRTGLTGKELENLTSVNLKFSKITGVDVKESVAATQRAFAEWGIATGDQAAALNSLYFITTKTGIGTAALTSTIQSAGPALKAFGFSFNETAALIGNLEKHGLSADATIATLTKAMVTFADQGIKDPKAHLIELIEKMKNAKTSIEAVGIASEITKRGAVQFADAVRSGAFEFQNLATRSAKATDAMNKAADSVANWKGEWTKLEHGLELVLEKLGAPLLSAVANATKAIGGFAAASQSLDEVFDKFEKFAGSGAIPRFGSQFDNANEILRQGRLAGKNFADIMADMPKSLKLASTGALDFGLHVKILAEHAGGAKLTLEQLAEVARQVASAFSALGLKDVALEAQEASRAFALLFNAGRLSPDTVFAAVETLKAKLSAAFNDGEISEAKFNAETERLEGLLDKAREAGAGLSEVIEQFRVPEGLAGAGEFASALNAEFAKNKATAEELSSALATLYSTENLVLGVNNTAFQEILNSLPDIAVTAQEAVAGIALPPWMVVPNPFANLEAAFENLGIKSSSSLRITAKHAWEDYNTIRNSGVATALDIDRAWVAAMTADINAGANFTREELNNYERIKAAVGSAAAHIDTVWKQTQQSLKRVTDDLSRGIAQAIVQFKSLGDVFKKVAQQIAEDILQIIIKSGIQKLLDSLAGLSGTLGKIGTILGGVARPGGGGSGSGEVAREGIGGIRGVIEGAGEGSGEGGGVGGAIGTGVRNTATIASQTGQTVAGAASSLAGWVNVGVSALSGIVQGIQGARTNNLLAEIEKSTRFSEQYLFNLNTIGLTYQPNLLHLVEIWGAINQVRDKIGGGNIFNITVNARTDNPREIADSIVRQLKLLSPAFSG
jgi:hypothetical protein